MNLKIFLLLPLLILAAACSTPKNIAYFEDAENLAKEQVLTKISSYEPKIKCGDKLVITVSAIDPVAVAPFNMPINNVTDILQTPTAAVTERKNLSAVQSFLPYVVDSDGYINFPVIGKIDVRGVTPNQLTSMLEKKISESVDNPIVNIRIDNFKVSVLGEVLRPGSFNVYSDRISLFDVLGMAGDLTIYGDRQKVFLVRDENGEKKLTRLDLTKSDILESPFFYLQQNDVVYVEPNDKKKKSARYSQTEQYNLSVISTLASTLSVITTVILSIVTIKNK